jgi:hypothetical protein
VYRWKQFILRRQPHSHNMESGSISIANCTSLGNGFRPKVNHASPCVKCSPWKKSCWYHRTRGLAP